MVVFGLNGCYRAKIVLFGESGFIRAKLVLFRQSCCIWEKVVVFVNWFYLDKSGCYRAKWLY